MNDPLPPSTELSAPMAALDLGSNSFHLIVAREAGGQIQVIDRHRERVALGAGLDENLLLDEASQMRALASLERFAQRVWDIAPERLRVVATNTLRVATNAEAFLEQAEATLGAPIEVISGLEEARLTWHGVNADLPTIEGKRLLIDIGGGSTECIIGNSEGIFASSSLQLGCVSMSAAVFADGKLNANRFRRAKALALAELQPLVEPSLKLGWQEAFGSSGTINAIAKYLGGDERTITARKLRDLEAELIELGHCDELTKKGIREDRARVIPGGLAVLRAIFQALKIDKMKASDSALREGVLFDLLGRINHQDVRRRAIRALMWRFHVDVTQAKRVRNAADQLFDLLPQGVIKDPIRGRELLHWAAQSYEIGLSLSYSGYHKHSAYLALNSELDGFSQQEQRQLAYLLLCHRRKLRQQGELGFFDLSKREIKSLQPIALILRLAVLLTRSRRDDSLEGVKIGKLTSKIIVVELAENWIERHPLAALDLDDETRRLADAGIALVVSEA